MRILGNYKSKSIKNEQINEVVFKFFENKRVTTISSSVINTEEIIWVGTSNGLYYFNTKDSIIEPYFNDDLLSFNKKYITKVITQNDSTIWVGALGGGLKKINYLNQKVKFNDKSTDNQQSLSSSFINYYNDSEDKKSISSSRVVDIKVDKWNRIWLATDGG